MVVGVHKTPAFCSVDIYTCVSYLGVLALSC